ncbi:DUF6193 family natural product biosynthesis protein [Actinomadura miaoliensis]|uniref:Uncharacterized protein n=1 Tax=Actinomadura miaoliensis TaxID=430685 RepID=A0ABP7WBC3_9ACTN
MTTGNGPQSPHPSAVINGDLYPDLVRMGGLTMAVIGVAAEHRIDIGEVLEASGKERLLSAKMASGSNLVSVLLGARERRFSITVSRNRHVGASGGTDDLLATVRMASYWLGGSTLAELSARFPFMSYNALSAAHERGNPLEFQWKWLLTHDAFAEIRHVLQAVHAVESLRSLFPIITHGTLLRLYDDIDLRPEGQYWIAMRADGTYRVEVPRDGRSEVLGSLAAAVETLVSYVRLS